MTTTTSGLKISNETLEILKNFSSINSNILVKPGNLISTISPVKNIMAEAKVAEDFDCEFGIWDLNKFLGTISLFKDPSFYFEEKFVNITSKTNKSSVKYYYSEPSLLTTINKKIVMPETVVNCTLTEGQLTEIKKASSVLQVNDIAIRSNGSAVELVTMDKNDSSTNNFSIDIGDNTDGSEFVFYFKSENLKMLQGSYDIRITEKVVSEFKHQSKELTYWVALESDSTYSS
ncbi:MAG: hypothetical protein H8D80_00290 [Proteobacteria bacterium]|nr:hypothetical protein [Pseudomonadota bacterium]